MKFEARPGQESVLDSSDPVLIVLGGAGTGKTTVAAAAVRKILNASTSSEAEPRRALFLSFSRAAVDQIVDRTGSVLGGQATRVEITTFHGFAWDLCRQWGDSVGLPERRFVSPSEQKLFGTSGGITYNDLLPLALRVLQVPAIRQHFGRRWKVIVADEFQDTSDEQFELIMRIRGSARLLLLGDLNQCIYANLPGVVGVGPQRVDAALALPGARMLQLPDVSHRDPTNILPAAATAIRQRNFAHEAVAVALASGVLDVRHHHEPEDEGRLVAAMIRELRDEGHESVGVFSHHVDATASLSDHLNGEGIAHEIVGLPDSVASGLQAQFEMLCYAEEGNSVEPAWRSLGIFIASVERGPRAPDLAKMVAGQLPVSDLVAARLSKVQASLVSGSSVAEVLGVTRQVPDLFGLTRGVRAWTDGAVLLQILLGPRLCRSSTFPADGFDFLRHRLTSHQISLQTYGEAAPPADVRLMGLYQAKGREADATIVVLRGNDYYGKEPEPQPNGSKLLYVVLTRARKKTIVLTLGSALPPLVRPLAVLKSAQTGMA